jgi:type IV pilus assembly protein PilM
MLFGKSKSQLGVDIGTSNIKIVQLRPDNQKFVLETYGLVNVSFQIGSKESASAVSQTASLLKSLLSRARVTTNEAIASLPNSVVFTSVIDMPKVPDNELKAAVEYEAKKYIPLPLDEVTLSWSIIQEKRSRVTRGSSLNEIGKSVDNRNKILLTAVPNVVVDNYQRVFELAGLKLAALEIESLSLIRSLVSEESNTVLVIDIGAKNTSINLVQDGYLRLSKNLSVGGDTITTSIAQSLSVNFVRAEQFKKDFGLSNQGQQIPQVMRPILDIIKNEVQQLINIFESRGEKVDKILLSGGAARLPSLAQYFSIVGKPIVLANPWTKVIFSSKIKPVIEPLGLNLAVAVGLAMRKMD